ncbi:MAG: transglutaminase domain-containing protein [Desulfobacteraceae bacterium]|nr:transglutaminase domain-containing protein [Desulfobacteraceae bacterium]MBC2754846.1 transglutaminase domain-containing protein [Desulfobacteraceae bacterium]
MQSKKSKKIKIFFSSVLCLLLFGASATFLCDIDTLVKIKYFLFTDKTSSKLLFTAPLNILIDNGFKKDSPQSIEHWKSVITNNINYLQKLEQKITGTISTVNKAKLIALSFSKGGGGGCLDDIDLISKMKRINKNKGHGCCSDHAEVFVALCSIHGIVSREVHNNHHAFNEFFMPENNKWLWIDPLFTIMAQNDMDEYLSLFEIRDLLFNDLKVNYVFFGNESHEFYNHSASQHEYFDEKNDFSDIMITWGNNVFAENEFNSHLNLLPKSAKQFIGLMIGKTPSYKVYVDKFSSQK